MKYSEKYKVHVARYVPEWFYARHNSFLGMWRIRRHYKRILPVIRAAAREHGYAIGVHGTMARDLDLIAAPWTRKHSKPEKLLKAISTAVMGHVSGHEHMIRPMPGGRLGVIIPVGYFARLDISITSQNLKGQNNG